LQRNYYHRNPALDTFPLCSPSAVIPFFLERNTKAVVYIQSHRLYVPNTSIKMKAVCSSSFSSTVVLVVLSSLLLLAPWRVAVAVSTASIATSSDVVAESSSSTLQSNNYPPHRYHAMAIDTMSNHTHNNDNTCSPVTRNDPLHHPTNHHERKQQQQHHHSSPPIPQPDPSIIGYPVSRYSPDRRLFDQVETVRAVHQSDNNHQDDDTSTSYFSNNPLGVPALEWKARTELAAAYRYLYMAGLGSDQSAQCLMLRTTTTTTTRTDSDSTEEQPITFLMADWGVWFEEVTASNLLHFTVHGDRVEYTSSSSTTSSSNIPGYHFIPAATATAGHHPSMQANTGCIPVAKAILEARPDVSMIVHIHPPAVMAVGGLEWGLLPLAQAAFFLWGQVSREEYDFTYETSFEESLAQGFAAGQRAMLLNHHGMYAVGRDAAEAIFVATHLTQACEVQVRTLSMAGGDLDKVRVALFLIFLGK
jgi:ribulose-5-phosphate 4-epimerase/fuculose-1-phosphate aldolase